MSLLQKLVESYDHMADKYAGLYIDTMREPLAPISHTKGLGAVQGIFI